jgi:hypothetical protein
MKPFKTSRNSCLCGVCIIIGAAKTLYGGFWLLRPSWFENERQSFFVKTGPNLKSEIYDSKFSIFMSVYLNIQSCLLL